MEKFVLIARWFSKGSEIGIVPYGQGECSRCSDKRAQIEGVDVWDVCDVWDVLCIVGRAILLLLMHLTLSSGARLILGSGTLWAVSFPLPHVSEHMTMLRCFGVTSSASSATVASTATASTSLSTAASRCNGAVCFHII
jgi:hypothetical protein